MTDTDVDFAELVARTQAGERDYRLRLDSGTEFKETQSLFVKSIDQANRRITAVASTGNVDRHGEIILPSAFEEMLPIYMTNPVVIASHQHRLDSGHSSVVGNAVKIWIDKVGLNVIVEFEDETELGKEYWTLYSKKRQRAFSVGFIPLEWKDEQDEKLGRVRIYTKVELLELSCVPVGSNRESLSKARQRKADFVERKRLGREADEFAEILLDGDFEALGILDATESVDESVDEPEYSDMFVDAEQEFYHETLC